jgi:hypothetical protein
MPRRVAVELELTSPLRSDRRRLADWPLLAFTAVSHVLSLVVSYLVFFRLFGMPAWIVPTLSFNK